MLFSITTGDINLDGALTSASWLVFAVSVLVFVSKHSRVFTALFAALLPTTYRARFLETHEQLGNSLAQPKGEPNHSGTPRQRKSRRRT